MDAEKRKTMLSIILGLIIVFSVLSMVFRNGPKQENDQNNQTPTPVPKAKGFHAEDINGLVTELTSTYVVFGYTDNYNMQELVRQIRSAGFDNVSNPNYRTDLGKEKAAFVFHTALKKDANLEVLIEKLKSDKILSDISYYRQAIVKIPAKITLKEIDSNNSKDINLEEPFIPAIVSNETMSGDSIKVNFYAQVQGSAIVKGTIQAFEQLNISSQPYIFVADTNAIIEKIEASFLAVHTLSYMALNSKEIENEIKAISDVNDALLQTSVVDPLKFKIDLSSMESKDIDKTLSDINSDSNSLISEHIKKASMSYDQNKKILTLSIEFKDSEESYKEAKSKFSELLKSKSLNYALEDANLSIELQVILKDYLASDKRVNIKDKIKEIFLKRGIDIPDAKFTEEGILLMSSIKKPGTDENIAINEPVRVMLAFGRNVGDYVDVKLTVYAQRGKALGVFATEKSISMN
ncbi:MAG: hypothetical protein N3F05_01115 [Candidatus Diapherotrites archaeon]|nr:hypothetical protein [Candidatus Diapherotrites archaeon]